MNGSMTFAPRSCAFTGLLLWSACVAVREEPVLVETKSSAALAATPGVPSPPENFTDFGTLKILTYNSFQRPDTILGAGVLTYDAHDVECRARQLARDLRTLGDYEGYYDVILLQETFDSSALEVLFDELDAAPKVWPFRVYGRPNHPGFDTEGDGGLTILSRHPLHHPFSSQSSEPWDEMIFSACSGGLGGGSDCMAAKGIVWTSISFGEVGMVDLVVTHTDALQGVDDINARKAQFDAIREHLETFRQPGRPTFIAGDLNVDDTKNSLFDNESGGGCTLCPRVPPLTGLRADMMARLNGTGLWNLWAAPERVDFLSYSRNWGDLNDPPGIYLANYFAGSGDFRDWDDDDYRARFDHLIYYNGSGEAPGVLITMDSADDIEIRKFENTNCTDSLFDPFTWPPVIHSTQTMHNLSDHYGIEAKIHFWKDLAAAAAVLPPAAPTIPTFNNYVYEGPHYRLADGIARTLGENMSYTGRWQVAFSLDASRTTAGPPIAITLEEEELDGTTWYVSNSWQTAAGSILTTDGSPPSYGKSMSTQAYPGMGAIDKPMSPDDRYYRYRAKACNTHGCSPWTAYSETVRVWYKHAPLGGAAFGTAYEPICGGAIGLAITAVAGATHYLVYSSHNSDASGSKALVYRGPSVNLTDADPPKGIYKYWVQACQDDKGDGTGLSINCTRPTKVMRRAPDYDSPGVPEQTVPFIRTQGIDSGGVIRLEWPRTGDATEYHLQEARNAAFNESVVSHIVPQPASGAFVKYGVSKPFNSGDFYFRVRPRNAAGEPCGFTRSREPVSTSQLIVDTHSVSFDGVDEYVNTNRDYATGGATKATWSFWVKPTGFPGNQDVWSKGGVGGQTEWVLRLITGGRLRVFVSDTGSATVIPYWTATAGPEALTANVWQHVAVVFNGSLPAADRIKVYKNGAPISGSVTGTLPASIFGASTLYARIGAAANVSPINYYSGKLSQMALWIGMTLSLEQIQELHNLAKPTRLWGRPSDQASYVFSGGPPHHWYQMGEDDTFPNLADGGVSGTIKATMMNMEAADIVTDAP